MSTVGFIPARGGSKGLPNKNILDFCGKPLIAWSIEQALNSEYLDNVYVSTDSEEIADIAKYYGAEVPFLRPAEISGDTATTESAMFHFCDWLKSKQFDVDNIMLIQATSPIRKPGQFCRAIKQFEDSDSDSLLSVTESHRFFWVNPEVPTANYDYLNRPRRQDISSNDRNYLETGSFYITKINMLIESKSRLCGKISFFQTEEEEAYEIDSLSDFKICETLYKNYLLGY
jgi:N-acylneuraminate cytidylyltransferase